MCRLPFYKTLLGILFNLAKIIPLYIHIKFTLLSKKRSRIAYWHYSNVPYKEKFCPDSSKVQVMQESTDRRDLKDAEEKQNKTPQLF